jgi:hypothetical protein
MPRKLMAHHAEHTLLVVAAHVFTLLVLCATLAQPTEQMSFRVGKAAPARGHPQPKHRRALLIIDVQNSFMPDGSVPIPEGDAVVQPINRLLQHHRGFFDQILYTQDWHPANHISFDTAHPGRAAGDVRLPIWRQCERQQCSCWLGLGVSCFVTTDGCQGSRHHTSSVPGNLPLRM